MDVDFSVRLGGLVREHRVPGAQLAVHHRNETIMVETGEQTYGTGVAVTSRSAFPLGSLTKPFTATLAMVLVAGGDVELDAPLADYVPQLGIASGRPDARITLRRLLSHTSGLAANIDEAGDHSEARRHWIARHCREADAVHRPGTVFSYSNIGYILAGHLIEVITGMSWWEAVDAMLLRPLDIVPAFVVGPPPSAFRPIVLGHTVQERRNRVLPVTGQILPKVAAPSAGLALSAADLVTFTRMHLADPSLRPMLDRDSAAEMRRDQLAGTAVGPFGMADSWGLGWAVYRDSGSDGPDVDWFGHDGTGEGTSCHLRFEPTTGTVVALTVNAGTGSALWEDLLGELRSAGLGVGNHRFSTPPHPAREVPVLPECAGRYVNGEMEFTVVRQGADFRLKTGAEERFRLIGLADLHFTMREPDGGRTTYVGRFLRDPKTGEIDLIQVSGRLARRAAGPATATGQATTSVSHRT